SPENTPTAPADPAAAQGPAAGAPPQEPATTAAAAPPSGSEASTPRASPAASATGAAASGLLNGVGVAGGLPSEQAGRRAAATSRDAEVQRHEVLSAQQDSRKTFSSLLPRVTATARYTRLSKVPLPSFGSPDALSVVTTDGP